MPNFNRDAVKDHGRLIGPWAAHAMSPVSTAIGVMLNGILDGRTDLAHTAAMWTNKTQFSPDFAATKRSFQQDSA